MEYIPSIHRIDNQNFRELIDKINKTMNGTKVSDDNSLKFNVYRKNTDYKRTTIITSAADDKYQHQKSIRKLEIFRDPFGTDDKMVFSQKVHCFKRFV